MKVVVAKSKEKPKRLQAFKNVLSLIYIILGVFSAGFGLKSLLLPNHFIDGGATGISLMITHVSKLPFSIIIILINIPFLFIGYKKFGKKLVWSTMIAITGLSLAVQFFPYPFITNDKLLVATFGGFFLGGGIGLAMRGGAVLDGTEILALSISNRISASVGDIILLFNLVIFSVAAYLLGIESALYSILTYLVAAKAVDFLVEGIEEYTSVTIISYTHSDEISRMIIDQFERGVTTYQGTMGHGKKGTISKDIDILVTVITRLELSKIKSEIIKIDPAAFFFMQSVKDMRGGIIKKRPLKNE